jgi:hypothetical protein
MKETKNIEIMKHTKGNWTTGKTANSSGIISVFGENINGRTSVARVEWQGEETEANAKLIAAAPELLEVAKMWQKYCDVGEHPTDEEINFMDKIIKKATE